MITCDAIILGAGSSLRFLGDEPRAEVVLPKQFHELNGSPVLIHCLRSLFATGRFRNTVVALAESYLEEAEKLLFRHLSPEQRKNIYLIAGGKQRHDSSKKAMKVVETFDHAPDRIIIHDGCRPFLSPSFIERLVQAIDDRSYAAWIPVIPMVDTLKRIENKEVIETVDRRHFHCVQTPQIFEYSVIRSLFEKAESQQKQGELTQVTDDASLCEYFGIPVGTFAGDVRNIKLTYEFEIETLRSILVAEKIKITQPENRT